MQKYQYCVDLDYYYSMKLWSINYMLALKSYILIVIEWIRSQSGLNLTDIQNQASRHVEKLFHTMCT